MLQSPGGLQWTPPGPPTGCPKPSDRTSGPAVGLQRMTRPPPPGLLPSTQGRLPQLQLRRAWFPAQKANPLQGKIRIAFYACMCMLGCSHLWPAPDPLPPPPPQKEFTRGVDLVQDTDLVDFCWGQPCPGARRRGLRGGWGACEQYRVLACQMGVVRTSAGGIILVSEEST